MTALFLLSFFIALIFGFILIADLVAHKDFYPYKLLVWAIFSTFNAWYILIGPKFWYILSLLENYMQDCKYIPAEEAQKLTDKDLIQHLRKCEKVIDPAKQELQRRRDEANSGCPI